MAGVEGILPILVIAVAAFTLHSAVHKIEEGIVLINHVNQASTLNPSV